MSLRICKKYQYCFFRCFRWLEKPIIQKAGRALFLFLLIAVMTLIFVIPSHAQASSSNPGEWMAYENGNKLINNAVKNTTKRKRNTNVLMLAINKELTDIDGWEDKYMSYLAQVQGFASTLKSSSMIVADGVKVFMSLHKLAKAVEANPTGLVATEMLNNTLKETVSEFITIYYLMEYVVAKGGNKNLLSGRARCEMLYCLEDKMSNFSKKLNKLVISASCYNMSDVWFQISAGVLMNDREARVRHAANHSLDTWKRRSVNTWKVNN